MKMPTIPEDLIRNWLIAGTIAILFLAYIAGFVHGYTLGANDAKRAYGRDEEDSIP
jgi:hypothetical protein